MIILILLLTTTAKAPIWDSLVIVKPEAIQVFDPMLYSFMAVESNFDTDTINRLGYGGILQIGEEMVNEVNRINEKRKLPERFVLKDRLDSLKAVRMWYIVQGYWNPQYKLRRATHVWNPLASSKYYDKINKVMRGLAKS